ncbi:MAG: ATP-binding protein [Candidatus Omnitrophota bacterium]|nr:ATP-binding protein [Candidatus Omnitrophota bacterium]
MDIKKFGGNIFELLKESEKYISERINWRVQFGKLEREEIPEVPLKAIREALVNSLCHRDYANPKGNEIAIFKDRVEIYNPGDFPEGYTPEDFIKGKERSILRNPLIAETIYKSKDIEKWGSGLKRIYDECRAAGVPVELEALKSGFVVTFYRPKTEVKQKTVEKTVEKILALIKENPGVTQQEISKKTGLTRRGIEWNLKRMKDEGLIHRIGPDKGGHWEILG